MKPTEAEKDEVYALLRQTYWADQLPRDVFEASLEESVCVVAKRYGKVVGFARAVTDRVTFTWLCDVVVDREHRGVGIGKDLVRNILTHPHVANTTVELRTRDAHGFYFDLGFNPEVCMVRRPQ